MTVCSLFIGLFTLHTLSNVYIRLVVCPDLELGCAPGFRCEHAPLEKMGEYNREGAIRIVLVFGQKNNDYNLRAEYSKFCKIYTRPYPSEAPTLMLCFFFSSFIPVFFNTECTRVLMPRHVPVFGAM